jgi:hypothetical protein
MKKLLALLVIIMLTASIVVAVENPFSFSLYNQIKLKAKDGSQPGRMPDVDSRISYAPDYDFQTDKAVINDEMKCSASITLAEIYTMGFFLKGVGEIGFGGDAMRVEFSTGMTNAIQAVPDYLKIEINSDWVIRWEAREVTTTTTTTYIADEADTGIDWNGDGDTTDEDVELFEVSEDDTVMSGQHVDFLLKPKFALSGKIPDTGISWGISEAVELKWNPENHKDTDPTLRSYDDNMYTVNADSSLTQNHSDTGSFEYAKFETKVTFDFEFFHFFAPENITGTIKLMNNFKVKLPYSYYLEEDKTLNDEFEVGFELGLAGPKVYIAFWGETEDKLNTSAPLDGDLGSHYSWEGTWIGNEGTHDDGAAWDGEWSDMDATSHGRPNLKIGTIISFSYSKEWFSFGTKYKGYETGIRKYDEDGLNDQLEWINEFEIYAKFSL